MQAQDSYEPLIGNVAPDFEAEAVFDQEFIKACFNRSVFRSRFWLLPSLVPPICAILYSIRV